MKTSIQNRLGQHALELTLFMLLLVAAFAHLAEPGVARNAALMGLVFVMPALASACVQVYRDISELHHGH